MKLNRAKLSKSPKLVMAAFLFAISLSPPAAGPAAAQRDDRRDGFQIDTRLGDRGINRGDNPDIGVARDHGVGQATGNNLGSYTGQGLGSYTGGGLGSLGATPPITEQPFPRNR